MRDEGGGTIGNVPPALGAEGRKGLAGAVALDKVYQGDCREVMATFEHNTFDAVVTDPPYELTSGKNSKKGFMGKEWDGSGIAYDLEVWGQCLRVLKPGGYLLAFSGTRTYHRMVCAIEDSGFIIHPLIGWVFGSGFPKATNLSKQFDKDAGMEREVIGEYVAPDGKGRTNDLGIQWGNFCGSAGMKATSPKLLTTPTTDAAKLWDGWFYGRQSLKPALEPICMAQKPPEGKMTENVLKWGTGGINVDACRVEGQKRSPEFKKPESEPGYCGGFGSNQNLVDWDNSKGRFPANLLHDGSPEVLAEFAKAGEKKPGTYTGKRNLPKTKNAYGSFDIKEEDPVSYGGSSSAARFFQSCPFTEEDYPAFMYYAKASKSERGEGNNHPTVKSLSLMKYLCRLITPPNGLILDPFAGSGTTCLAAKQEGFKFVGIELQPEYCEIARKRLMAIPARLDSFLEA